MTEAAGCSWHEHAVAARKALDLLGYPVRMEECLPGEPGGASCGMSDQMHALAYYAALRALADHHLGHVTDEPTLDALADIYHEAACNLQGTCRA